MRKAAHWVALMRSAVALWAGIDDGGPYAVAGACGYAEQASYAQQAGAAGVIIFDSQRAEFAIMNSDGSK